jgi:ATP-dependent protease ClpP protease subunit
MTTSPLQVLQALNAEGRQWYSMRPLAAAGAAAPTRAEIRLYDAIGFGWWGLTSRDFTAALDALDVDEIDLFINSPGGLVSEAVAIKNALVRHRAKVTAFVDGMCASAATIVALGADEIVMMPESEWMIHDAWMAVVGPAADMAAAAERLDQVSDSVAALYARRAGGTAQAWRDVMSGADETWYSAQEAVTAGFADRVAGEADPAPATDAKAALASAVAALFAHTGRADAPPPALLSPAALAAQNHPATSVPGSTSQDAAAAGDTHQEGDAAMSFDETQLTALRQKVGVREDADPDTILAAIDEALQERSSATVSLPPGTTAIDEGTLAQLQADAAAGREARETQRQDHREQLASAAVADGRIPPARKQHWLSLLEADPEGTEAALAALPKGLVPVAELGHDTFVDAEGKPEDIYSRVFPTQTEEA